MKMQSAISHFLNALPKLGRFGLLSGASIALSLLAMWSLFAAIAYETYRDEWTKASVFCADVGALLEQDVARNAELYDLSIKAADQDMSDPAVMALPLALRRKVLFDQSANASGLGSILVLDRSGRVVLDSKGVAAPGLDLADRDYFIAQRDRPNQDQPFISHPFMSRITQRVGIGLSRRRTTTDGSFDGIVVGTITLDYFARLFKSVNLPAGSTITLVHQDGTILMREPEIAGQIGRNLQPADSSDRMGGRASGLFTKQSQIDGVDRLFAFKQVGALPMHVTVGLSIDQLFAHWRWRVELIGLGFLVLSAIILFLGVMLGLELHRRTEAECTLADLASTDSLTALSNRRRFDVVLDAEWRRAARDGTSTSLLMIDGDFFKAFNDTYGHVEGDDALRGIARVLTGCVARPGDLVARFGGEEFVVLLPSTDEDGAINVARAIRHAMAAYGQPHRGSPMGVLTVSIGAATRTPSTTDAPSSLLEAADLALYAAKAQGRNRIVVAASPGDASGWRPPSEFAAVRA